MEILSLIAVAGALERGLVGATLDGVVAQARRRYRLRFDDGGRGRSIVVCCDPTRPWVGRPVGRWPKGAATADPFAAAVRRALVGTRLTAVDRPAGDRRIEFGFAGRPRLVAELAPQRATLVLLDSDGRVVAAARRPPRDRERLTSGVPYAPPPPPPGRVDPLDAAGDAVGRRFAEALGRAADPVRALRSVVLGVGPEVAAQVAAEATECGPLHALAAAALELASGERVPVVEGPADLLVAAREGRAGASSCRMHPWAPARAPADGWTWHVGDDALDPVGLYHDALDRAGLVDSRARSLRRLLHDDVQRTALALERARRDRRTFDDPERERRLGEALLAGLHAARREGGVVRVPDPYDADGDWLVADDPTGAGPVALADRSFARHRRALRGLERASARIERLETRLERLERLAAAPAGPAGPDEVATFEQALREAGVDVGLERATRARREACRLQPARRDGVRELRTACGATVLVGKSARDNQRLTFQIARADDVWLHAQGVTGAHVVLRAGDKRGAAPPERALREAAAIAAWFSESRRDGAVDVQWTRRKHVRRLRGAPPGAVGVAKFKTIRVAPRRPDSGDDPARG